MPDLKSYQIPKKLRNHTYTSIKKTGEMFSKRPTEEFSDKKKLQDQGPQRIHKVFNCYLNTSNSDEKTKYLSSLSILFLTHKQTRREFSTQDEPFELFVFLKTLLKDRVPDYSTHQYKALKTLLMTFKQSYDRVQKSKQHPRSPQRSLYESIAPIIKSVSFYQFNGSHDKKPQKIEVSVESFIERLNSLSPQRLKANNPSHPKKHQRSNIVPPHKGVISSPIETMRRSKTLTDLRSLGQPVTQTQESSTDQPKTMRRSKTFADLRSL